ETSPRLREARGSGREARRGSSPERCLVEREVAVAADTDGDVTGCWRHDARRGATHAAHEGFLAGLNSVLTLAASSAWLVRCLRCGSIASMRSSASRTKPTALA